MSATAAAAAKLPPDLKLTDEQVKILNPILFNIVIWEIFYLLFRLLSLKRPSSCSTRTATGPSPLRSVSVTSSTLDRDTDSWHGIKYSLLALISSPSVWNSV